MTPPTVNNRAEVALLEAFGNFRMEWTEISVDKYFAEPSYFHSLKTTRPCVIVGGRGTGKTTALQALKSRPTDTGRGVASDRIAVYLKIGPHIPNNFSGPERSESEWAKIFLNHIHVLLCRLVLDALAKQVQKPQLASEAGDFLLQTLEGVRPEKPVSSFSELYTKIQLLSTNIEEILNNTNNSPINTVDEWDRPLKLLCDAVIRPNNYKGVIFLIDEYENLLCYQQRAINTLIKFSSKYITYKIGIKELGWKTRGTFIAGENLRTPADYSLINIDQEQKADFRRFASQVVQRRLRLVDGIEKRDMQIALPGLKAIEEAERLATKVPSPLRMASDELKEHLTSPQLKKHFTWADELDAYVIKSLAEARGVPLAHLIRELSLVAPQRAKQRARNYRNVGLYQLGAKRTDIKKYYCGWHTLCLLSGGNIRFLMELTQEILIRHLRITSSLQEGVSQELQTAAVTAVAERNLYELEGMTVYGRRLIRLVQALGTLFSACARDGFRHTPELNQFTIKDHENSNKDTSSGVDELLREAVMHLALVRMPTTKRGDTSQLMSEDYALHPIYSPFFRIPFQRKRKIALRGEELLGMSKSPDVVLREVLNKHRLRGLFADDESSFQIKLDF